MIRIMIPKTQRLSDEELKKLIELYNSVKDKKDQHKNKLCYSLG